MKKSSGGIIYTYGKDKKPKFLVLKRQSLSNNIEWVAPKGKIDDGETPQQAALREIKEETSLKGKKMILKDKVGSMELHLSGKGKESFDKHIQYYLIRYKGEKNDVDIAPTEGYLGYYKWAGIDEVVNLIYYENLRELYRKAYNMITN